jgi:lipopolysaccharide/colanic/teichoic acid biosynthesis glycosyltransferase
MVFGMVIMKEKLISLLAWYLVGMLTACMVFIPSVEVWTMDTALSILVIGLTWPMWVLLLIIVILSSVGSLWYGL